MHWKKIVTAVVAAGLFSAPTWAGSFGIYGSNWDSEQTDSSTGGGGRLGFSFVRFLELDFHGTYYPDFTTEVGGQNLEVEARPVEGGLRVNLFPGGPVNPFVGAGVTYFFLDTDQGDVENKTGVYGQAGLEFGGNASRFFIEALWREVDTTINLDAFDMDAEFDGFAANAGFAWRWGG